MPARVTCREYDKKRGVPVPGCQRLDVNSRTLLKMIQRGKSFKETAKRFGIVKSTICYRLRRDFPKEYRKLRVNPTFAQYYARCAEAHKAYERTGTIGGATKELGLPKSTVLGRIKFMEKSLKQAECEEELRREISLDACCSSVEALDNTDETEDWD